MPLCMYLTLYYSSVCGHQIWLFSLAIMNSAAINMAASVSVAPTLTFLLIYAQVWYCWAIFSFWETSILISLMVTKVYIPSKVYESCFSCIFANIFCYLFNDCQHDQCEISFWFAFPWWLTMMNIFSCTYRLFVLLLRTVCSFIFPFIIASFVLLMFNLELFIYCEY
jgi:hypothetical protein